jgi:hypothetical protein
MPEGLLGGKIDVPHHHLVCQCLLHQRGTYLNPAFRTIPQGNGLQQSLPQDWRSLFHAEVNFDRFFSHALDPDPASLGLSLALGP